MLPLEQNTLTANYDHLASLPSRVSSVMEIDLDAVVHNYRFLQQRAPGAACAAVVKADAYGLGAVQIAPTLAAAGCKTFFVATLDEALELRKVLPNEAQIFMLNGLLAGSESNFSTYNITPVLNDLEQIILWQNWAKTLEKSLPAAIHIDSGMWRAGLPQCEVKQLAQEPERLQGVDVQLIMSHLACSDQPDHPKNQQQLQVLKQTLQLLPPAPASLANSHGILLGPEYHFDLTRPGRGLYGIGACSAIEKSLKPAARVYAKILQIRNVEAGETVGYEATYQVDHPLRIATLSVGYTDGLPRTLDKHGAVYIGNVRAPIIGGVSMDLLTVDASAVPEKSLCPGSWTEIIGTHITADMVASNADRSTSREIMVNLGPRYHRIYKKAAAA